MDLSLEDDSESNVPLMRIGRCIFVTAPSELGDTQVRRLQDAVANRLYAEAGLLGLVIDVSTLGVVDSYVAKVLEETARMARSFGVRCILVGLRPAVAVTLVELGIDLSEVETARSLEAAMHKLKLRIVYDGERKSG